MTQASHIVSPAAEGEERPATQASHIVSPAAEGEERPVTQASHIVSPAAEGEERPATQASHDATQNITPYHRNHARDWTHLQFNHDLHSIHLSTTL